MSVILGFDSLKTGTGIACADMAARPSNAGTDVKNNFRICPSPLGTNRAFVMSRGQRRNINNNASLSRSGENSSRQAI
jgi:hypothetical protein